MNEWPERHLRACAGFTAVVEVADGRWDAPTPCSDWDARAVVEHVIGFHDVLLLRPLGTKPERPKGDPRRRWELTIEAINVSVVTPPPAEGGPDLERLLPLLMNEVLVHTWDLGRATGVRTVLDEELCRLAYDLTVRNEEKFRASGLFAAPVAVGEGADMADKLLALHGRDPNRSPS
jgi:uncharacterized protein (TIGR03083 family)